MLKTKGKLDALINCAGVVNRKSLKQATLVDWDKSIFIKNLSYSISDEYQCKINVSINEHECSFP